MRIFYIFLFSCLFTISSFAITCQSTSSGKWFVNARWSCGYAPGCPVDTIIIRATDSVYVDASVTLTGGPCTPVIVVVNGILQFKNGSKLTLLDGSNVIINSGGRMIPGGGGGSSNYLEIGGNKVWTANDGIMPGPFTFTSATALPIKLLSFEVFSNNKEIDLKWITSVEINNDFFTIEKSRDLKNWEAVTKLNGAGNSNVNIEYFEVDYSPYIGISYYRLKQTDYDGIYSFSNIVPVKFDNKINSGMSLFPNPIVRGNEVKIQFSEITNSEVLIVLRSVTGQEYYSKAIIKQEDNALIAVPIDKEIPSGMYVVTASSENQIYNQKLLIK